MSRQRWVETLISAQVAGSAFNTFTTAKSVLPTHAVITLPQGYLEAPGTALEIDILGAISNIVTTPGTITFQVMLGSVVAFTTGAVQMSTTAHTNAPFHFHAFLTTRAVGNSTNANLAGQSVVTSQAFSISGADTTTSHTVLMAPNSAPAVGTGFDSTASQTLDFWTGFSISNGANQITIHQYFVKSLN